MNPLNCYLDFVGLRRDSVWLATDFPEPISGSYISDFEGVDGKLLASLSDHDARGILEVWQKIQSRALISFKAQVLSELHKKYKAKVNYDQKRTHYWLKDKRQWGYRVPEGAVQFEFECMNEWLNFEVVSIEFYAERSALNNEFFRLDVSNYQLGYIQNTESVNIYGFKEGYNSYQLNHIIDTALPGDFEYQVRLETFGIKLLWPNSHVACGCGLACGCIDFADVIIPDVPDGEFIPGQKIVGSPGFSIRYRLRCNYERYLCQMRNELKDAWAYACFYELCRERLASIRTNDVTYNKDMIREHMENAKGMMLACVDNAMTDLNPPKDDCFFCNPITQYRFGV